MTLYWQRRLTTFSILFVFVVALDGCKIERPDPASAAAAILHKHPTDFLSALTALDALASAEIGLPPVPWVGELYRQSGQLKPLLTGARSDSEKVGILNAWIFDTLSIATSSDSTSLSGSLPSRVLTNHKGSCLGLTLLYLSFGQTLGLPLYPVFLPGHIIVRFRSPSYTCNIETLRRGLARSDAFYRQEFFLNQRPWYKLMDAEDKQALAALVFNLGNTHRAHGDLQYALAEYQLTEEAIPGFPEALGNQGAVYITLGSLKEAEKKLSQSVKGDSVNNPASINLTRILEILK